MNAQLKYARCATCEHALITGVACDSGPVDCPLLQVFHRHHNSRFAPRGLRVVPSDVALPGEYDAVRGED